MLGAKVVEAEDRKTAVVEKQSGAVSGAGPSSSACLSLSPRDDRNSSHEPEQAQNYITYGALRLVFTILYCIKRIEFSRIPFFRGTLLPIGGPSVPTRAKKSIEASDYYLVNKLKTYFAPLETHNESSFPHNP